MATSKKTGFRFHISVTLNIISVLLLISCHLSSRISPDYFWPAAFIGLIFPFALALNLFFILYWFLRRKWFFIISLATVVILWDAAKAQIRFLPKIQPDPEKKTIKVMSFNAMYFDRYNQLKKKPGLNFSEIIETIHEESPDLICFQEFYTNNSEQLNVIRLFTEQLQYPFYNTYYLLRKGGHNYGMATFSRFPLTGCKTFVFGDNPTNAGFHCDAVIGSDTIRVFNVHFESLRLSREDRIFINEITKQDNSELRTGFLKVVRKMRIAFIKRAEQARKVNRLVSESPHPVVLCTDMNDTPGSYSYHQISRQLKDSFAESGFGLGKTYAGFYPSFRIDYIFHDPKFTSKGYRTIRKRLSDHYPIVTYLQY